MMCYRDMTFCSASVTRCKNEKCFRYFGENQKADAQRWWGGQNSIASTQAPVAFGDFSKGCDKIDPVEPAPAMVAQFKHDCDRCKLIAVFEGQDWYTCPDRLGPTILCRFSNTPSDYWSMAQSIVVSQVDGTRFMKRAKFLLEGNA
jgi:hypothetical protein